MGRARDKSWITDILYRIVGEAKTSRAQRSSTEDVGVAPKGDEFDLSVMRVIS